MESWNLPLQSTFSPWKWFKCIPWVLDPKNLGKDLSLVRWSYIEYKAAAAIMDAILNYTFLPNIWNVYQSFFSISYGSLQGSRVKIRGHNIAHRTPWSPGLLHDTLLQNPGYCGKVSQFACSNKISCNKGRTRALEPYTAMADRIPLVSAAHLCTTRCRRKLSSRMFESFIFHVTAVIWRKAFWETPDMSAKRATSHAATRAVAAVVIMSCVVLFHRLSMRKI